MRIKKCADIGTSRPSNQDFLPRTQVYWKSESDFDSWAAVRQNVPQIAPSAEMVTLCGWGGKRSGEGPCDGTSEGGQAFSSGRFYWSPRRTNHTFPIVVRPAPCASRLRPSRVVAGNLRSLDRPTHPPDDTTFSLALPILRSSIAVP